MADEEEGIVHDYKDEDLLLDLDRHCKVNTTNFFNISEHWFTEELTHYELQFDLISKPKPSGTQTYVVARPSQTLSSNYVTLMNFFGNLGGFSSLIEFMDLSENFQQIFDELDVDVSIESSDRIRIRR